MTCADEIERLSQQLADTASLLRKAMDELELMRQERDEAVKKLNEWWDQR